MDMSEAHYICCLHIIATGADSNLVGCVAASYDLTASEGPFPDATITNNDIHSFCPLYVTYTSAIARYQRLARLPAYVRNFEVVGVSSILSVKNVSNVSFFMIDTDAPVSIAMSSSFPLILKLVQNAVRVCCFLHTICSE